MRLFMQFPAMFYFYLEEKSLSKVFLNSKQKISISPLDLTKTLTLESIKIISFDAEFDVQFGMILVYRRKNVCCAS